VTHDGDDRDAHLLRDDRRLRELAQYVAPGPWQTRRSDVDGSLMLYGVDDEPLALIYAGADLGHYLEQCAPAVLLPSARPIGD
jgi:hypothetical protein